LRSDSKGSVYSYDITLNPPERLFPAFFSRSGADVSRFDPAAVPTTNSKMTNRPNKMGRDFFTTHLLPGVINGSGMINASY